MRGRPPGYVSWCKMNARCYNPNERNFKDYGGRGIAVCAQWRGPGGYEQFIADMGLPPSSRHQIDRKKNGRNYTPSNCRWTTHFNNQANRRNNHELEFRGKKQHIRAWSRETGIGHNTLFKRFSMGWSIERILTKPVRTIDQSWRVA